MLGSRKARHAHFRYCGYGCCGPYATKEQERRILRKVEKRGWVKDCNDERMNMSTVEEIDLRSRVQFDMQVGDYTFDVDLSMWDDGFVAMNAYGREMFAPIYDDVEFGTKCPSFAEVAERIEELMIADAEAYDERRMSAYWGG